MRLGNEIRHIFRNLDVKLHNCIALQTFVQSLWNAYLRVINQNVDSDARGNFPLSWKVQYSMTLISSVWMVTYESARRNSSSSFNDSYSEQATEVESGGLNLERAREMD